MIFSRVFQIKWLKLNIPDGFLWTKISAIFWDRWNDNTQPLETKNSMGFCREHESLATLPTKHLLIDLTAHNNVPSVDTPEC